MRFLFVVSGKDAPSTRFRMLPYVTHLESAGHRCDVAYSFPQKYDYFKTIGWRLSQRLKRIVRDWHVFLANRRQYDAIVIEREVFDNESADIEVALRKATRRLILDLDDGVFLRFPKKIDKIARMCDAAIAGNQWLEEYLVSRTPEVVRIPTCVRLADYPVREPSSQRTDDVHIGWIGTTQNVNFLKVAAPALRSVAQKHSITLVVVAPSNECLKNISLEGVNIDFRKWSPETEVADLRDMDIGLMPLPDGEEWMKYKCGLKLIQYLAVGIPGIASPIGVNEALLQGNRVGRAATNQDEWTRSLLELIESVELRRQLGTAGRDLVERDYSIEGNWQKFERCLIG